MDMNLILASIGVFHYLHGSVVVDGHLEYRCRALQNLGERLGLVVFQMQVDAESGSQRRGELTIHI